VLILNYGAYTKLFSKIFITFACMNVMPPKNVLYHVCNQFRKLPINIAHFLVLNLSMYVDFAGGFTLVKKAFTA